MDSLNVKIEIINDIFCQLTLPTGAIVLISLGDNFDIEEIEVKQFLESSSPEILQRIDISLTKMLVNYMIGGMTDWTIFDQ